MTIASREKRYGMQPGEYNALFLAQQGLCAICQTRLAVFIDHCHDSQVVRGLLCPSCNSGLGMFQDNLMWLERARQYVANSSYQKILQNFQENQSNLLNKRKDCYPKTPKKKTVHPAILP